MGRELRLNAQIGDYDMDFVILDMRFDVNIITKQTRENMGKPKLLWSHVSVEIVQLAKSDTVWKNGGC